MAPHAAKQPAAAANDTEQVQRALDGDAGTSPRNLCKHIIGAFIELPAAFCAITPTPKTPFRKPTSRPLPTLRELSRRRRPLRAGCPASLLQRVFGTHAAKAFSHRPWQLEQQQSEAQIIQFPQSTPNDDPERTMAQRQIIQLVEQATDNLPEAFRLVFVTRVIEGMSTEETSELLGIKPETVKTRLHRARQLVRDQLEKEIGPVLMDAFPFAGRRCERMTEAVMKRLGFSD